MRIVTIVLCIAAAGVVGAQKSAVTPPHVVTAPPRADANAKTPGIPGLPGPRLKLVEARAIAGKKESLEGDIAVDLGPRGLTVIRSGGRMMKAYDSTGRRLWTMDRNRDGEIGDVTAIGWRGDEMWVSDRRFSQIALVDKGVVATSLELPSWVRPSWSNRKNFPVFGTLDVYAFFSDGSMTGVPRRAHSIVGTVGYDSTMQYVLHVSESGIVDRAIAKFPSSDFAARAEWSRAVGDRADRIPSPWLLVEDFWPRLRISPDGQRTVVVTVDTSHGVTDSIGVAAVNTTGTPVFARAIGLPRMSYSESQIDSIAAVRFRGATGEYRAQRVRSLPRMVAAVRDVTLGHDYSVWVTLRETDGGAKPIVGIDAAGNIIGTIYLPRTLQLKAADRGVLWIVDYGSTFRDVVRYTIGNP